MGYYVQADQDVMICFDLKGNWTGYLISTDMKTYNCFDLKDEWTGMYICSRFRQWIESFRQRWRMDRFTCQMTIHARGITVDLS